jgi:hypothetical protein
MRLTVKEHSQSVAAIKVHVRRVLSEAKQKAQAKDARLRYLYELQQRYHSGEISIDLDDPRTTYGLTKNEVDFILEDSDDTYEDWRDARLAGLDA